MKLLVLCLLLISCKTNLETKYIENDYDDSKLQAYELIQDARLDAIENRESMLEQLATQDQSEISRLQHSIDFNYALVNATLTQIQLQVEQNKVQVLSICASSENLIKVNANYFAVYMVSNNFGTFLGKLDENVLYQTTDIFHARFKINNGVILCL